jgi:hypothetical protein
MLTFWGNIEEADIAAYAATLILPSYMSHLQLSPFRFATQQSCNSGEQSLTLTYTGPGRIEQFELSARENALELLCHTCPGLQRNRVQLPTQGAIWLWPPPKSGKMPQSDRPFVTPTSTDDITESGANMRLFFRPVAETLAAAETPPQSFPPEKAYLSISRGEIFLHTDVITAYFRAWLEYLGMQEPPENVTCRATTCGFIAESPYLTIEATIEPNDIFQDMLQFAGLSRWFGELDGNIAPDLDAEGTTITNHGLLIALKKQAI